MMTASRAVEAEMITLMPALHRFATRFCSGHDCDDLVQDTLTKAFANTDKFTEGTHLKSWLFTIMRNTFYSRYAKGRREQVGISDEMMGMQWMPAPQESALKAQELESALSDLSPLHYQALHMVAIEGISYEEAAGRSCCAIGTIKSRVNRARQQLSVHLDS